MLMDRYNGPHCARTSESSRESEMCNNKLASVGFSGIVRVID